MDNHVIKYIPPEEFKPMITKMKWAEKRQMGCLLVGSENIDPSIVTKEYCGLFNSVGMLPKRHLCRFIVSPEAILPTGTPLLATHFRVGDHIDIRAKTLVTFLHLSLHIKMLVGMKVLTFFNFIIVV